MPFNIFHLPNSPVQAARGPNAFMSCWQKFRGRQINWKTIFCFQIQLNCLKHDKSFINTTLRFESQPIAIETPTIALKSQPIGFITRICNRRRSDCFGIEQNLKTNSQNDKWSTANYNCPSAQDVTFAYRKMASASEISISIDINNAGWLAIALVNHSPMCMLCPWPTSSTPL